MQIEYRFPFFSVRKISPKKGAAYLNQTRFAHEHKKKIMMYCRYIVF